MAKSPLPHRLLTGAALARASALSVRPDTAMAQTANQPGDLSWFDANVPCRTACPADTDIPGYLDAVRRGDFDAAYRINLEDNVFPGVLGRVCSRPCEAACRHGIPGNGEPVAICFSKRGAADHRYGTLPEPERPMLLPRRSPPSGKSVAVVGAGVAGLACARELVRRGHRVTVFDRHRAPGGMLVQGIPMFRLPRKVIEREIGQIAALGVEIRCGVDIGRDIALDELAARHDAVVLAAGTLRPRIPAIDTTIGEGAEHGLEFLLAVNEFGRHEAGSRVLVIGGGYTALDCARTVIRLGAKTTIAYRRGVGALLLLPGEIEAFAREGGTLETNLAPLALTARGGHVCGVRFARTGTAYRGAIELIAESEIEVSADHVIFATGQQPDVSWAGMRLPNLVGTNGRLSTGTAFVTAYPKIFAAGDFALGATTLITAIGHAKGCAAVVDRFLGGTQKAPRSIAVSPAMTSKPVDPGCCWESTTTLTGRDKSLNGIPLTPMPLAAFRDRDLESEAELGYAQGAAQQEASRCYLCDFKFEIVDSRCVLCDECLLVKPVPDCIVEIAALELDAAGRITGYRRVERDRTDSLYYNRLWIDQSRCVRCGACEAACPVNAITVQKVTCESFRR